MSAKKLLEETLRRLEGLSDEELSSMTRKIIARTPATEWETTVHSTSHAYKREKPRTRYILSDVQAVNDVSLDCLALDKAA